MAPLLAQRLRQVLPFLLAFITASSAFAAESELETRLFNGQFLLNQPHPRESTVQIDTATVKAYDVRDLIERNGITFPPGASADLLADSGLLILKNDRENLGLFDTLLNAGLYCPSNPLRHAFTLVAFPSGLPAATRTYRGRRRR